MPATYHATGSSLKKDFGGTNYTLPNPWWVGLSTTVVNASGCSSVTEPVGNNYARVAYGNGSGSWTTPSSGSCTTTGSFAFPTSTGAWGTIVSVFLSSASQSGDVWFYHELSPSIPVVANTTVTFAAGTLVASRT